MRLRPLEKGPSIAGKLPLILASIGVLAVLIYTAVVSTPFARGPELILSPLETLDAQTVLIQGKALRVSRVLINDMDIPLSETGEFSVERAFPAGYTVVTVRAEDRFGRVRERIITFITHTHAKEDNESSFQTESDRRGVDEPEVGERGSD